MEVELVIVAAAIAQFLKSPISDKVIVNRAVIRGGVPRTPWIEERIKNDPLLARRGSGKELWADEHADEYVRRLREGWE